MVLILALKRTVLKPGKLTGTLGVSAVVLRGKSAPAPLGGGIRETKRSAAYTTIHYPPPPPHSYRFTKNSPPFQLPRFLYPGLSRPSGFGGTLSFLCTGGSRNIDKAYNSGFAL
jgi:hypothetical protein